MIETFYQILNKLGYHHPLHPVITHLPVGMVIGTFIFGLLAWILRKPNLAQTARHCIGLALIGVIPTVAIGYVDWQHFYAGAWITPIRWKLILAALLAVLLIIAWLSGRKNEKVSFGHLTIYFLCLCVVTGLGYFGGELVYGEKGPGKKEKPGMEKLAEKGGEFFAQNCSMCHYTDSTETKIGPGLKGLFDREKLPVSGRPVTAENVENQIKNPYKNMPAFEDITQEEIAAVLAYLKTL